MVRSVARPWRPRPTSMSWPDDTAGPWKVSFEWGWSEQREVVTLAGLKIEPMIGLSSDPELTPRLLRTLGSAATIDRALRERVTDAMERADAFEDQASGEDSAQAVDWRGAAEAERAQARLAPGPLRKRPGRQPLSQSFLEGVAEDYRRIAQVHTRKAAAELARQRQVSRSTVANWLARCRHLELLPVTDRTNVHAAKPGPACKSSHAQGRSTR